MPHTDSHNGNYYDDVDPSWWDDESFLMAVDLGFDESGDGDILLVSMQLGIIEQAKRLKRKWKSKLSHAGVSYFHSSEYDNFSHGVFKGLSRKERAELLASLSKLIHRHLGIGVTIRVSKSFYDANTTQQFRSQWGTAYGFAVNMLIAVSHLYMQKFGLEYAINVLIEKGHRNAAQAVEMVLNVKPHESLPLKVLSAGLGSKQEHPILQAADMLAYSEWQDIRNGDRAIWNALHTQSGTYLTEFVDGGKELIEIATRGVEQWLNQRKEFGEKRRREYEERIKLQASTAASSVS